MSHDTRHLSDETLLASADDELSPQKSAHAASHLADCERCRRRLDRIRGVLEPAIERTGDAATVVPRVEELRRQLRATLPPAAADLERSWWFRVNRSLTRVPHGTLMAAASVAAILVVAGVVHLSSSLAGDWSESSTAGFRELPLPSLTPGATSHATAAELCAAHDVAPGPIPADVRRVVVHDYGVERVPPQDYELDYLITPELGGTAARENLWPERYSSRVWNARVKDELEGLLPQLVCQGQLDLGTAQRDIAANWIAAYQKYFHTDRPIQRSADVGISPVLALSAPAFVPR